MPKPTIVVIDSEDNCPEIPIVEGDGRARAVVWPGSGASHRSFNLIELLASSRTVALSHEADSVYYVIGGAGSVHDLTSGQAEELVEGSMVHIDAGDEYRFVSAASQGMRLLGGPCPADDQMYAAIRRS